MYMLAYKHLLGYLHRYTLIHIKRLHCRIHRIRRPDITPFLHTHPFSYISIILWGGYTEDVEGKLVNNGFLSVIRRDSNVAHRITAVKPGTVTLFLTWKTKDRKWRFKEGSLVPSVDWVSYPKGIYTRELYGKLVYSKFDQYWFKASPTPEGAQAETDPSIDQSTPPTFGRMV